MTFQIQHSCSFDPVTECAVPVPLTVRAGQYHDVAIFRTRRSIEIHLQRACIGQHGLGRARRFRPPAAGSGLEANDKCTAIVVTDSDFNRARLILVGSVVRVKRR
jgi:hypothetical protein